MEKRKIGSVEIVALVDTVQTFQASAVYPEADDALGQFSDYLDADGGVELAFTSFLINDGDAVILVDTGFGPENGGQLRAELAEAGVNEAGITTVVFTHLHGDHTGWNVDRADGSPLFPNARYLAPQADWDHFSSQDPRPPSFVRDIESLRGAGRLELIEGETPLSRSVTTLPTPGHTPGHMSMVIASTDRPGFILGDVVLTRIDSEMPTLTNSFDTDSDLATATRAKVIERLAADASLVGASHIQAPGFGRFHASNNETRWVPARFRV
ncbi:MAG: MBL fold metallo-hydrolase [Dehalococcoidia bacterium]|nr:MBL fold metallo-hydrolase [Dehalococcoidia bacterium]HJP40585.1 MBL fold metallo-hydrolase [Dehalococcoidia bacterium]